MHRKDDARADSDETRMASGHPAGDPGVTMPFAQPAPDPTDPGLTQLGNGNAVDHEATIGGIPPLGQLGDDTMYHPRPPIAARREDTSRGFLGAIDRLRGSAATEASVPDPSHGPIEIGQAFGSRYHIIRVLGVGGMGAVYQAWDAELGVAVAVKVVRPEIAADPVAASEIERRFKRELLLARQVTHPNVVRIHDLGEVNGIKYITMPFIEGADLATILKEHTKLPVDRALRIARGVVSGLVAAHGAGVVHRDLKPANIMIGAGDETTLMDFGIARSAGGPELAPSLPAGVLQADFSRMAALSASRTVAGAIVGTVAYMAPEQAKGVPVDQRADIYALGLILYDMLIGGRRAARAQSAIEEMQGRMVAPPPPPRSVDPAIPEAVDAIIRRCLEPDAANRFQKTVDLEHALARLDAHGKPLPIMQRVSRRTMFAVAALVAVLLGGTYFTAKKLSAPEPPHDPVTVVIADFQNNTSDPTLNKTLGQTVRRALEGASFITAYDRSRISSIGARAPEKLDEAAAREIALKQGLGVVIAGSIAPSGEGYEISVKALQTVTGNVITNLKRVASNRDQILETATKLSAGIRRVLGDKTSESAQLFAMRSLSTTSLDVVGHYAAAVEAQSRGQFEEAQRNYLKAVELDPKFGLGYQGLAAMSRNLERLDDADKYIKEALRYLDTMTDRERLATRGYYDRLIGDNQQCAKEYGELIERYPADTVAHMQRGLCLMKLRQSRDAVNEIRQAVQILPNHAGYRTNLAFATNAAGDFEAAEQEIQTIPDPDARALLALAYSQVARGELPEATVTYQKIATKGALGASFASSGLGDIAVYEGRFSDAVRMFEEGAVADLAANNSGRAAIKLTSAAYAHLLAGRKDLAVAAAEKALLTAKSMPVRFLAARMFVEAGAIEKARPLARALSAELPAEPQAHGKIIEGLIALKSADPRGAIKILTEANTTLDTWFGHFDLGRAYLAAGALPQADSEFDRCISRRGEALSLMDEGPTYGQFPLAYYYQGRVRESLKTASYADAYRAYLKIRGASREDSLVPDVRRRAGD